MLLKGQQGASQAWAAPRGPTLPASEGLGPGIECVEKRGVWAKSSRLPVMQARSPCAADCLLLSLRAQTKAAGCLRLLIRSVG